MSTDYSKTSPYYTTSFSYGYLDTLNFRDISANSDDVLYIVTQQ
jgi:hypothetical protein